ncbi:HNH endonuclease [Mycobacteriaceae bacterium 1482268.1]|nr:HNH endonuclease [Mycobacteriaceae bacterium 1482268.1]
MFDVLAATAAAALGGAAIGAWAQVENAACARRLSAIADLLEARCTDDGSADREQWCLDNWGAVAAEVAASHEVSFGVASHQLMVAMALRERLPRVNEVFHTGRISYRLVQSIVHRTALVTDPQARANVDAEIAVAVPGWGALSVTNVERAIDYWVDRYDPYALRRTELRARGRHVDCISDGNGLSTVEAVLFDHDAATLDKRLDAMADAVCDRDGRTRDQRRADAFGALAARVDLACGCGDADCCAAGRQPNAVVINVIAEQRSLSDNTAAVVDGENPDKPTKPLREMTLAEAAAEPEPTGPAQTNPGVMIGGPIIPAPLLAAKVAAGATMRWIVHPGDAPPEPGHRASVKLDRFVRCRDMTCRFPGCTEPADMCDVDHTIPYPIGPTCASNLKCLCRKHHLLKTFWGGRCGWRDDQLPDGTVVWTDPSGQTHMTRPGSYGLFPQLCRPTAAVVLSPAEIAAAAGLRPGSGLAMPRRKQTRSQDRAQRVIAERRLNEIDPQTHRATITPPTAPARDFASWLAALPPCDDTPPPF